MKGKSVTRFGLIAAGAIILTMLMTAPPALADLPFETFFATFQQGVDGYEGTHDTWVRMWHDGQETRNWGGADYVQTYGHAVPPPHRSNTLIKFDNVFGPGGVPAGVPADDIISATLTMTIYDAINQGNGQLRIRAMLTPWEAGTGVNRDSIEGESSAAYRFFREDGVYAPEDYWGNTGAQLNYPQASDYGEEYLDLQGPWPDMVGEKGVDAWSVELDVTAAVKGWADGTVANHGFYLSSEGAWWQYYRMYSSNWEANPEWRPLLTVEYIPEPSSLLLLAAGSLLALMRRRR